MSSEYEKKNEPGQKDDKSMGGRQGQNPQGGQTGREGESENWREGQGDSSKKPSTGSTDEPEAE
jgi:hypothetical protein